MNLHRTFEHLIQGLLRKDLFAFGMRSGMELRELRAGWICAGDVDGFAGGFRWATEIERNDETEKGTHSDVQSRAVYEYGLIEQSQRSYMREKSDGNNEDGRSILTESHCPSTLATRK